MQAGRLLFMLSCMLAVNSGKTSQTSEYRLNKDVEPEQYDIYIKPYLHLHDGDKQFSFEGRVNITLHTFANQVQTITLHKKYIEIQNAYLFDPSENSVQTINKECMAYDTKTDKLQITLKNPLVVANSYILSLNYRGQIRNITAGFYRATNDNVRWYGLTQLHRIHARTVFPCFDEPEFKAKFRMHISRTHDYRSFFNTRLTNCTNEGFSSVLSNSMTHYNSMPAYIISHSKQLFLIFGRKLFWHNQFYLKTMYCVLPSERIVDHFEETPPMSSYLVAFVVGYFISEGSNDLKIIMDKKFLNKTNFSYKIGLKALQIYNNYTQMPYKSLGNSIMQMVGTNYFPHSGMENWGLVFYKEVALAQEPDYTDGLSNKELTVSLLFHETAHMWFGNSVTHKWWSYFWLNEAFPTYYQYFLANEHFPEYEFDKQFIVKEIHLIFDLDARNETQPLTSREEDINTPSEIASKFSHIAYSKGAAVLRMFRNLMGQRNFDKAIGAYLQLKHLKTATPSDLFTQLKTYWPSTHDVDLDEFFKDWTEQPGYPVVNVSVIDNGFFLIRQQRFLLDATDGSNASLKYTIPITFSTDKLNNFRNFTPKFYLGKQERLKLFAGAAEHKWIVVNNQQSNYYRVSYDSELLDNLKTALLLKNYSGIHVKNRAAIIDDIFAFGLTGMQDYDKILNFVEYLQHEVEYLPWKAAFEGFKKISQRLSLAQHYIFGEYIVTLLDKQFETIAFESSDNKVFDMYHHNNVISWLCRYDQEKCNNQAHQNFQKHFEANTQPNSDLREALYCAAVRQDKSFIYKTLKNMFLKQQFQSEKEKLLRAMGCTCHFVPDYFEFLLTKDVSEDLKHIGLKSLLSYTPANIGPVFDLIIQNTRRLTKTVQDISNLAETVKDIAPYITTPAQLMLLKQFISEEGYLFGPSITKLKDSVKMVEKNLQWSAKYLPRIMNYLIRCKVNYRLTSDVIPHLFNPADGETQFNMNGEVNITVQTSHRNQRVIWLHKDSIRILKAVLYDVKRNIIEQISNESMFEESLTDTLTVVFLKPLQMNMTYVLHFKYSGQTRDDLAGVSKDTYDN